MKIREEREKKQWLRICGFIGKGSMRREARGRELLWEDRHANRDYYLVHKTGVGAGDCTVIDLSSCRQVG